ncbi:alanine--tRNA ligase [Candidatus Woesearchaeota archaeon]|nr:MAG: alanine--tRNA ligase [Candidatus Woesearchaeota archaeon]
MKADKEIKREFKLKASRNPDDYYATSVLKEHGFSRHKCVKCGTYFWSTEKSEVCGDPACSGGYRFIGNSPAKKSFDYIGAWKAFASMFRKKGYTPIPRYPVAARWRDDTDFVQASIYDFQPFVVSGEVKPPANPLVVPQFCLRFNDIDNVGITGAHYTGFVMIGQHAFMPPKEYNQKKYFEDIHDWLVRGMGIPKDEIIYHEDAWAGGGNFGPCMEFFSRGLELGNQVYMFYSQTPKGYKELNIKVLDMGAGHERFAWFTKASSTSYETTFPTVMKKLHAKTGVKADMEIMRDFLPHASYLNVDEVEDAEKAWGAVSKKVGLGISELKREILPLAALYSVAEHSRALLVALTDGVLPSNVGGGYNLRMILRRALSFINKYEWQISLPEVCEWHASYLKPLFPELRKNLNEVEKILEVERRKFKETIERSRHIVSRLSRIDEKKLVELYDSHGISPDFIKEEFEKNGKKLSVPDNFYARVASLHENKQQATQTRKELDVDFGDLPDTKILYYEHYDLTEFEAVVLAVKRDLVVLDKTAFYPTSGGQLHDTGTLNGIRVEEVLKHGNLIVHRLESVEGLRRGMLVKGKIDFERRLQLAQHHTATHIINGVARKLLGNHVWQAGASKSLSKARLDITHYEKLSPEEIRFIEEEANKVIQLNLPVNSYVLPKDVAEKKYGFILYQGGFVPGKSVRVIEIKGLDVEACGGTHLKLTGEAERITILKTSKIQDGIVRIEFAAGMAARKAYQKGEVMVEELAKLFGVPPEVVPARAEELFAKWKKARKARKKGKKLEEADYELSSSEKYDGDVLARVAEIFSTQPEHVVKTASRFLRELNEFKKFSS